MKNIMILFLLICTLAGTAQIKEFNIVSKMDGNFEMDDGTIMPFWGFGIGDLLTGRAEMPGPLLEVELGDSVIIHFSNPAPEDHTIHLHGLDVIQVYDGVPTTSIAISSNGTYDYHWKANHVGSFLYHCHVQTVMHSSLGMYGMIVVKNKQEPNRLYDGGPGFNKDHSFLSSEMYTYWNLNPTSPGPFHLFDPDYFMINGKSTSQILLDSNCVVSAEVGDSVLLRLANVAFSKVVYNFPEGLNPTVYSSDGRIIPTPVELDSLELYAGERYGVILRPDVNVQDFITVTYKRMFNDEFEGQNLIAVNSYAASVDDVSSEEAILIEAFPNPSTGIVKLKSNLDLMQSRISVYDLSGKLIEEQVILGSELDFSNYKSGVYFIQFLIKGQSIIEKVVIE